jgi:hypothetical protein
LVGWLVGWLVDTGFYSNLRINQVVIWGVLFIGGCSGVSGSATVSVALTIERSLAFNKETAAAPEESQATETVAQRKRSRNFVTFPLLLIFQ